MISHRCKHLFFWLSGAGGEHLERCPSWEQRKYVAFGATVLVPTLFAFIASAYAISTLTDDWTVVVPVALAWSFIILTIDRALLATYRSYQNFFRKIGQFFFRVVVALLMGITISHPLTLLLFKDTIQSVVEEEREAEITQVRELAAANKQELEGKLAALETEIATHREKWNATFDAAFLAAMEVGAAEGPASDLSPGQQAELRKQLDEATAFQREKIATVDEEMKSLLGDYKKLQGELDFWQVEFEREVNGQRSGIIGLGPRAKSIRDDQLEWRREEAKRLGGLLEFHTNERSSLAAAVRIAEERVTGEYLAVLAEQSEAQKEESARVATLKRQVQEDQAGQFVEQQNAIRATISRQIDARLEELQRMQGDIVALGADERERVAAIRAEPRRDILTQTLALHSLFRSGSEGGRFAITAYLVLALLFMLVDTIPIIVKFFSKPGPYDTLVDCEEVRFDRERKAFLENYEKYMRQLSDGGLLRFCQDKPLERALIDGVDRSRAAKEFLGALLEMERAFDERMQIERARLAEKGSASERTTAILEDMAQTFYADMRKRMETFFREGAAAPTGSSAV